MVFASWLVLQAVAGCVMPAATIDRDMAGDAHDLATQPDAQAQSPLDGSVEWPPIDGAPPEAPIAALDLLRDAADLADADRGPADAAIDQGEAAPDGSAVSMDGGISIDAPIGAGGTDLASGLGNSPTIVSGAKERILLVGTLVTPTDVIEGALLVEAGVITCVGAGAECSKAPGALGATVIDTAGIISPGLIDTHNHILYDIFDESDWRPARVYQNHDQWLAEPRFRAMAALQQCLVQGSHGQPGCNRDAATALLCEIDKFGELKALVAGTTSVVGMLGPSAACFSSLARSIDVSQNGLGQETLQETWIFPPSKAIADGVCRNITDKKTSAYLVHCGEGVDPRSRAEFQTLASLTTPAGCLIAPQTAIVHGTAFGSTEFVAMAGAGMHLIWSPASNVFLYGATADIPAARAAGVKVALAPDWSIGGSQSVLDELRFADAWDNAHWNDHLQPEDLVSMVTTNAAEALALGDRLGRLQVGYLADIAVFSGDRAKPHAAIVAASARDVVLVMVGGTILYGDAVLRAAGPAQPGCEMVDICGSEKFLCVATSSPADKLDQSLVAIKAAIEQALADADAETPNDGWNFAPLTPLVRCR